MSFLPKIIKYILATAMFTPLIVGSNFIFPYIAPKIFVFELIVELALILWIYLILKKPEYRPSKNVLTISLSVFFLILIITSFLGANVYRSFFMDYERMDGVFHLLHFFVFFLIASSVFRKKEDWLELFSLSVVISPIVALVSQGSHGSNRLSGSLGNPDFIACYATFNLAFAVFLIYSAYQKFIQKIEPIRSNIYLITGIIGLISAPLMIWFSATRGAILALIAVIGLNILILPWVKQSGKYLLSNKIRKTLVILTVLGIFLIGGLYLSRNNPSINRNLTISRLTHISFHSGTVHNRLLVWKYGWEGFKERPIRGWGWENFLVPFNKHYTNKLNEPWFDKSHNEYLDILISSGILGLLAYLSIFVSAFYLLKKYYSLNPKQNFWIAWIFASLLLFYLLQNIPLFDTPAIYLMIFTIFSFIAWLSPQNQTKISQKNIHTLNFNYFGWITYSLVVIIIITISYQWVIKPAYASQQAINGFKFYQFASKAKDENSSNLSLKESQRYLDHALSLNTYGNPEIIKILSSYLNNLNQIK
ncbi:MAG TPA: O-antigen ligase domain-containing protein, partial [Candidatus Portnoybacteria bacterium]|nr:O-antigen ligase domain-containing protein [Candidatus Portnoybacteria bacterium]